VPFARTLLLVNYRPEYEHGWGSRSYYTQLRIDPLPPDRAEELLAALLGPEPELQPLRRLLIDRTEGNPFFIEESVRTLVETRALVGERGAYQPGRAFTSLQLPATVQAVLAARIDRLPREDKRLLQTAAVVGKDFPFALAKLRSGEVADGRRLLRQTLELTIAVRGIPNPSELVRTGEGELVAGNLEEARSLAERALALGHERRTRRWEASGLCLLGEVAAAYDPPEVETAEPHYRDAIRVAGELGLRPMIARSHLGLGRLYVSCWPEERSLRAPHPGHGDVPRDGHAILAGAGGGGAEGARLMRCSHCQQENPPEPASATAAARAFSWRVHPVVTSTRLEVDSATAAGTKLGEQTAAGVESAFLLPRTTPRSISPRRSSRPKPRSKASASRSPCSSPMQGRAVELAEAIRHPVARVASWRAAVCRTGQRPAESLPTASSSASTASR
jgi:hypothetical protein